jgi:hypothetical protein
VAASASIVLPFNLSVGVGQSIPLQVSLTAPAPAGGVVITLASNDPSVAFLSPATIAITQGATMPINQPQLSGVATGTVSVSASSSGYSPAIQNVQVKPATASATWYGACWQKATLYGVTGNFQAMDFALNTPAPVTVNASLFFTSSCTGPYDNMNDYGSLTGSTHTLQGFSHYPDVVPSSAIFWVGARTADGMCPPGAPCSGCVVYTKATPSCDTLP